MRFEPVGISGFSVYVPPYRVDLQRWCEWSGMSWDKVRTVVGTGFRMLGPGQSVYTMAATAALRLIERYDVDPRRLRFIGLGTESSTDNSAGAVIIRGMLDTGLQALGLPPVSRHCEVPEVKHACLGGIYAMKSALRLLAIEPEDAAAIVICADIAKYDLGSSGEPTQGAGAVAMLLEKNPRLLAVDLNACGSASAYRALDFRKPMVRTNGNGSSYFRDTPVFNGKYSTTCYLDEAVHALRDMLRRLGREPGDYFRAVRAVFMHRPYERMPLNSLAFSYLVALAHDGRSGSDTLARYCAAADVPLGEVLGEMRSVPDILRYALEGDLERDPYPMTMRLLRGFRDQSDYDELVTAKTRLGSLPMRELGNLYSASLPAWMAAGLEEAVIGGSNLAGEEILAVGYGSGDAAEALPMRASPGWAEAAARIGFSASLHPVINLNQQQYLALHRTGTAAVPVHASNEFIIDRIGMVSGPPFSDEGIEYYRYVRAG
jgi:hydroxymethylglutaryl-CoA synthase